jgi:hypothetical protein
MVHLSGKNIFSPIMSKKPQWSPFNDLFVFMFVPNGFWCLTNWKEQFLFVNSDLAQLFRRKKIEPLVLLQSCRSFKYPSTRCLPLVIWAVPWQNQHNGFATSMDPDQPAYPRSLIRIHAVRLPTLFQVEKLTRLCGCSDSSGFMLVANALCWFCRDGRGSYLSF